MPTNSQKIRVQNQLRRLKHYAIYWESILINKFARLRKVGLYQKKRHKTNYNQIVKVEKDTQECDQHSQN